MTDTSTLELVIEESLLDGEPQCEHSMHGTSNNHGGPAKYLIRLCDCPHCGRRRTHQLLICAPAWNHAGRHGIYCEVCGRVGTRDEFWELIETL